MNIIDGFGGGNVEHDRLCRTLGTCHWYPMILDGLSVHDAIGRLRDKVNEELQTGEFFKYRRACEFY
jgi:hypothetical protein